MLWELVLGLYGSRRAGQLVPAAEGKKMKEKKIKGKGPRPASGSGSREKETVEAGVQWSLMWVWPWVWSVFWPKREQRQGGGLRFFVLPGALLAKGKAKLWLVSGEGK